MNRFTDFIKTEFQSLGILEILQTAPICLNGVSKLANDVLKHKLGIFSVFDLATSNIFNNSVALVNAGGDPTSPMYKLGYPTTDMVNALAAGIKFDELRFKNIGILNGIGIEYEEDIQLALNVKTIRDLSLYPPFQFAKSVLNLAFFIDNEAHLDEGAPKDLLPKNGDYPTEKVRYNTLFLDFINSNDGLIDITSKELQPLKIIDLKNSQNTGFKTIATGAFLTFQQSWFAQGVTLGQLLHSMALAPGESTRIAVIDWSRRISGTQTEQGSELERLSNIQNHNRSINEVTKSVATEAQSGFSGADNYAKTTQGGTSSGSSPNAVGEIVSGIIDPLGFLGGGDSTTTGTTSSTSTTEGYVTGYSFSDGRRDISAEMSQKINDSSHQYAHAARDRWASVVKEVSQFEHESISTRVVTNYNHMHAMTVQYYEVVQVYRIETQLTKAEKCIFIPVEVVDFNDESVIQSYRYILARAALTRWVREELLNNEYTRIEPNISINPESEGGAVLDKSIIDRINKEKVRVKDPFTINPPLRKEIVENLWNRNQIIDTSLAFRDNVIRPGSSSAFLPSDTVIHDIIFDDPSQTAQLVISTKAGDLSIEQFLNIPDSSRNISNITGLSIRGGDAEKSVKVNATLVLQSGQKMVNFILPEGIIPPNSEQIIKSKTSKSTTEANERVGKKTKWFDVRPSMFSDALRRHLNINKLHYNRAIFTSLDSVSLATLLSGYSYPINGVQKPISQLIDINPIGYVGNFLVFKMASDETDESWKTWLDEHGVKTGEIKQDIVPLPSGGVFAEAVLGRSNSAEKLDLTRFWNWQDSPIPIQPTEIVPIKTGGKATPDDLDTGRFSTPIVNIMNPSQLPDPTGMASVLAAIQNGNMFRDMSGFAQLMELAQASTLASAQGATAAGNQSGQIYAAQLQAQQEKFKMLMKLAASAAGAMVGGPVGGALAGTLTDSALGNSNISFQGAKMNYGEKLDKGKAGTTSGQGANVPKVSSGNASPSGTQGSSQIPGINASADDMSYQEKAYNNALYGIQGASNNEILSNLTSADLENSLTIEQNKTQSESIRRNIIYYIDIEIEANGHNVNHANNIRKIVNSTQYNAKTVKYKHYLDESFMIDSNETFAYIISGNSAEWNDYLNQSPMDDLNSLPPVFERLITHFKLNPKVPILAICGGHQLIAMGLGGAKVGRMRDLNGNIVESESGGVTRPVDFLVNDSIFNNIGTIGHFRFFHHDEVKDSTFNNFSIIASTSVCRVQTLRWNGSERLIYSTQFHPEQDNDDDDNNKYNGKYDGEKLIKNFLNKCQIWHDK